MNFNDARNAYRECRETERLQIARHMVEKGFRASMRGDAGKGIENYTSGGRIEEYDLRNWMYVDAKGLDYNVFISLQAFDLDPNSYNRHTLMDRLGLYVYSNYSAKDAYEQMITTNIDLPMDSAKFAELDRAIDNIVAMR